MLCNQNVTVLIYNEFATKDYGEKDDSRKNERGS